MCEKWTGIFSWAALSITLIGLMAGCDKLQGGASRGLPDVDHSILHANAVTFDAVANHPFLGTARIDNFTGCSLDFSLFGSSMPPAGLNFPGGASDAITGTPTTAGTFQFGIRVLTIFSPNPPPFPGDPSCPETYSRGSGTGFTDTAVITVVVHPDLQITTPANLPSGQPNQAYSQTLAATGGVTTYNWIVLSGAPPAGFTLNPATGELKGTPTTTGPFTFRVQVNDSYTNDPAGNNKHLTSQKDFTLSVNSAPPNQVSIATTSVPNGTVGATYPNTLLQATGGTPPYSWDTVPTGTPPAPGLAVGADGTISGIPTGSGGTSSFTSKVTDSSTPTAQTATKTYLLTVNQAPAIISANSVNFTEGAAGTFTVTAAGFPTPTLSETFVPPTAALPNGVTFDPLSGLLSGKPAAGTAGTYNIHFTASNGVGTNAVQSFTLTVNSAILRKIAFQSSRKLDGTDNANTNFASNIWVMNADGTSQTALTTLTTPRASSTVPVWSPDRTKIAFQSSGKLDGTDNANTNFASNIWVMNADGSSPTPLTNLTNADSGSPVWSPDGAKIAFVSIRSLDGSDNSVPDINIWVMNADGSVQTPLTRYTFSGAPTRAVTGSPVWSPVKIGGQFQIAFDSRANVDGTNSAGAFTPNIWVINADGTSLSALTKLTLAIPSSAVAWSPDGSKIGFDSPRALDGSNSLNTNGTNPNGTNNIWVMNTDGTNLIHLTALTATGGNSLGPVWSPDGTKIGFDSSRKLDGTDNANTNSIFNTWVMNADGTSPTPLTTLTNASSSSPVWSPDGTKIAFSSSGRLDGSDSANTNSTFNIWLMNVNGTSQIPLTTLTASAASSFVPAWQP
jgi:Tol biopolymer transport system component